ncbi:hypothetical protein ACFYXM_11140 [Streptomyces sp. NPDC002476]
MSPARCEITGTPQGLGAPTGTMSRRRGGGLAAAGTSSTITGKCCGGSP